MAVPGSKSYMAAGKRSLAARINGFNDSNPNTRVRLNPPLPAGPPPKKSAVNDSSLDNSADGQTRLFVGNLDLMMHTSGPNRGRPKGFCFVEMVTPVQARACIDALHGRRLKGRELRVNYARSVEEITEVGKVDEKRPTGPRLNQWTIDKRVKLVKETLKRLGSDIDIDVTTAETNKLNDANAEEEEEEAEEEDFGNDDEENIISDILNS